MKKSIRKSLAALGIGASLLVVSAVPAHASAASMQCAYPQTVDEILDCACITAVTILREVTGDPWMCAG